MNIRRSLKTAFIRHNLNKRRLSCPFIVDEAEHFSLPPDADDNQSNSYYFSGHDQQGVSLLFRFAKRGQDQTEIWFAYKDADGNAYVNEKQLYIDDNVPADVRCVETGRVWTFSFQAELRDKTSGKTVNAHFDGTFTSAGDAFEFGHHVDARIMAKAIADQKWSRRFFTELKENDQVHYEQPGRMEGTLVIGGKSVNISLPAMRDHSYGKRDWNYMNRHFWLMALFEDGSSLNASMVGYPVLRELQTGYMIFKEGRTCVESAQIVGDVVPNAVPEAFVCRVTLLDGTVLKLKCTKETQLEFSFCDGGYTIYEGIGSFELDGMKGRGVLEFGWNRDPLRYA